MTTEEKALALVKKARQFCTRMTLSDEIARQLAKELEHAIEREQTTIEAHEADKKAFSDAAERTIGAVAAHSPDAEATALHYLSPFILPEPEPDPLVEAMNEALGSEYEEYFPSQAEMLRDALAARGYKIERIEQ